MNLYLVRMDSAGQVTRCELVGQEQALPNGEATFYVLAPTEKRAKAMAFERYRERQRQLVRERRARNEAEGKCQCGGKRDDSFKKCSRCRDRNHVSKGRSALRAAGHVIPPASKVHAFAETKAIREREQRLATLLEVKEAWRRMPNVPMFLEWLERMIREAQQR